MKIAFGRAQARSTLTAMSELSAKTSSWGGLGSRSRFLGLEDSSMLSDVEGEGEMRGRGDAIREGVRDGVCRGERSSSESGGDESGDEEALLMVAGCGLRDKKGCCQQQRSK
jgi:hypothetical protein